MKTNYATGLVKTNTMKWLAFMLLYSSVLQAQDGFIHGEPSLAYWTVGNKPDVVIVLHGGPTAAHDYLRPEWDSLTAVARVVYYDQRGCGKSEKARCYSWQMHVQDLKRIVNAFSPGKKVFLAGSSWGTTLALLYAYTFPGDVKGLVLSGTYAWQGRGEIKRDCSFYLPQKPGSDTVYRMSLKYGIRVSAPKENDKEKADSATRDWRLFESHPTVMAMMRSSLKESPALPELKKIKTPVLIFEGTGVCDSKNPSLQNLKDGTFQFKGLLQNLEVYKINACHDGWYTRPKEFFAKAKAFIGSQNSAFFNDKTKGGNE